MTPLEINVDRLLDRAMKLTGLRSLGAYGEVNIEGLRRLGQALDGDHRLSPQGRRLAAGELQMELIKELVFEADLERHPEIANVPVTQPIFIMGFGRTGSTFLHNLLALDPAARAPRLWELMIPSPPPRPETYESDPRIKTACDNLRKLDAAGTGIRRIHPMEADTPDECHWTMLHGPHQFLRYGGAAYWDWLMSLGGDRLAQLYRHYRLRIQHLQLFCRGRHWLSKSLTHQYYVPRMFDVFPDARVVRLHRDPVACVPSLASLVVGYRKLYYETVDREEVGERVLSWFVEGARRSIAADEARRATSFFDVEYQDLINDPVGVVRRLYADLGCDYGPDFDSAMKAHIVSHRSIHAAKHDYMPEQFGLSRERIAEHTAPYMRWLDGLRKTRSAA
jgi:hypothetical protein